jgi:hypothetical protein
MEFARLPYEGEVDIFRLPFNMPGPASLISASAISGVSNCNYHTCIITHVTGRENNCLVNGYAPRAFSAETNSVAFILTARSCCPP